MPGLPVDVRPTLARRRLLLLAIAAAAAGIARPSFGGTAAGAVELNDYMAKFWPVYDAAQSLPRTERAAFLFDRFFAPERALYQRAGIRLTDAGVIGRWLAKFDPVAPAVRQTHARFADDFRKVRSEFRSAFPDFDGGLSPVFLIPSLGWFDGHLEPDGKTLPLFFGADEIVHQHGAQADLGVLISHELYHCYQGQGNPELSLAKAPPLYGTLWGEGTAVYASEQLNPSASLLHVLLDQQALLSDGPATAPRVAAELLKRLDSTDEADSSLFFMLGAKRKQPGQPWPDMAGYYVGLLCARQIGRSMSLREMAFLPSDQVRAQLIPALKSIGNA
jgi:hypothetical protein